MAVDDRVSSIVVASDGPIGVKSLRSDVGFDTIEGLISKIEEFEVSFYVTYRARVMPVVKFHCFWKFGVTEMGFDSEG